MHRSSRSTPGASPPLPKAQAPGALVAPTTLAALVALAALVGLPAGCQTYKAKPLDLASHRAAFLARTPDAPEVAEFARTLAAAPGAGSDAGAGADATAAPFDPSDGISLPEAEAIALVFNAELRQARHDAGVSEASAANAGLWQDPTVGFEFTRILESTVKPNEFFGTIGFTIPISGRLEIEKKRLGLAYAAELAHVAELEWRTRMEVRRAWMRWSALQAKVATTGEFVGRTDEVLQVVDQMEAMGELARIEARLFRMERVKAATDLQRLEAECTEVQLELQRLMGLPPMPRRALVAGGLGSRSFDTEVDADGGEMEARLLATSPALLVVSTRYEVAERQLEEDVRAQLPDLQIGPGYGTQNAERQFLLAFSMPIPILNGNRRAIAEAFAGREAARTAAERTLEHAIADLAMCRTVWQAASLQRLMIERDLVPLVDTQYAEAREVARLGEVNTLVLLETLKQQQEAKTRLIDARRNEAIAAIGIDEIVGPPKQEATGGTP